MVHQHEGKDHNLFIWVTAVRVAPLDGFGPARKLLKEAPPAAWQTCTEWLAYPTSSLCCPPAVRGVTSLRRNATVGLKFPLPAPDAHVWCPCPLPSSLRDCPTRCLPCGHRRHLTHRLCCPSPAASALTALDLQSLKVPPADSPLLAADSMAAAVP